MNWLKCSRPQCKGGMTDKEIANRAASEELEMERRKDAPWSFEES